MSCSDSGFPEASTRPCTSVYVQFSFVSDNASQGFRSGNVIKLSPVFSFWNQVRENEDGGGLDCS